MPADVSTQGTNPGQSSVVQNTCSCHKGRKRGELLVTFQIEQQKWAKISRSQSREIRLKKAKARVKIFDRSPFKLQETASSTLTTHRRPHTMSGEKKQPTFNILVVGGGPAGLTAAIGMAERAISTADSTADDPSSTHNPLIKVTVRDVRYTRIKTKAVIYSGSRSAIGLASKRRGQVVTLQGDALTNSMSFETRKVLFENIDEQVWSKTSQNIAIREVEDQLLKRAQDSIFQNYLSFQCPNDKNFGDDTTEEYKKNISELYDVIIGADGSKSWVRSEMMNIKDEDLLLHGTDLALGISFDIEEGRFSAGLPFPQSHNVFYTLAQRRFLLNASSIERTGFLNMQISQKEYDMSVREDGEPCVFGRAPGFVLQENESLPIEDDRRRHLFRPQLDARSLRLGIEIESKGESKEESKVESKREESKEIENPEEKDKKKHSAQLWESILDGLRLFGIPLDSIKEVRERFFFGFLNCYSSMFFNFFWY